MHKNMEERLKIMTKPTTENELKSQQKIDIAD